MQLRYDDDFLESAILSCADGRRSNISPLLIRRFHRERERLYSILDGDQRNAAFFKLHAEWFGEWHLEKPLLERLEHFPLLQKELSILAFRKARSKNDEGAELYVNGAGKNGVVALRVARFVDSHSLEPFLNHELSHLQDMVDPGFGYEVRLRCDPGQERLVRERYRLFWDITIDGRLAARNMPSVGSREMRWKELDEAFSFWTEGKRHEVFEMLWLNPAPSHNDLISLATDPRDLAHIHEPIPGALCPLCAFPTFVWADLASVPAEVSDLIHSEFPNWNSNQGACRRCCEMYSALARNLARESILT